VRGRVELVAYPERVISQLRKGSAQQKEGQAATVDPRQRQEIVRRVIEQGGLRAQLRSGSLITGQLYVAFDVFPNAPKVKINWDQDPVELPTMPGTLPQLEDKLTNILTKIEAFQFEAIGQDVRTAIATFDQLLKEADKAIKRFDTKVTPEIKLALDAFKVAADSATKVLNNTDTSLLNADAPAQQDLRNALQEFTRAARSLRVLMDYLEQHPDALLRGKTEENR
jgi:paraquat-inducible protein B